jgi:SET domain-containing protein
MDREAISSENCNNIMIRRNVPRKTYLGTSTIHGLGLFMGEEVQSGEYIGEYKGEIITKAEAERRALIYDQRGTSYLFGLNNSK